MMWCKLTCCILYLYLYLYGGIVGVTEYNKLYNGCLPTVTSLRPTLQSGEIPTMHTMPTIPTIHMWLGKCQAMPTHVVKNISLFICFFFHQRDTTQSSIVCTHWTKQVFFLQNTMQHMWQGRGKSKQVTAKAMSFTFSAPQDWRKSTSSPKTCCFCSQCSELWAVQGFQSVRRILIYADRTFCVSG